MIALLICLGVGALVAMPPRLMRRAVIGVLMTREHLTMAWLRVQLWWCETFDREQDA